MKLKFYHGSPFVNIGNIFLSGEIKRGCFSIQRKRAVTYTRGHGAVFCFTQDVSSRAYLYYLFTRFLNQLCRVDTLSDWIHDYFEGVGADFEFMLMNPLNLKSKDFKFFKIYGGGFCGSK